MPKEYRHQEIPFSHWKPARPIIIITMITSSMPEGVTSTQNTPQPVISMIDRNSCNNNKQYTKWSELDMKQPTSTK